MAALARGAHATSRPAPPGPGSRRSGASSHRDGVTRPGRAPTVRRRRGGAGHPWDRPTSRGRAPGVGCDDPCGGGADRTLRCGGGGRRQVRRRRRRRARRRRGPGSRPVERRRGGRAPRPTRGRAPRLPQGGPQVVLVGDRVDRGRPHLHRRDGLGHERRDLGPRIEQVGHGLVGVPGDLVGRLHVGRSPLEAARGGVLGAPDQVGHHVPDTPARAGRDRGLPPLRRQRPHQGVDPAASGLVVPTDGADVLSHEPHRTVARRIRAGVSRPGSARPRRGAPRHRRRRWGEAPFDPGPAGTRRPSSVRGARAGRPAR